MEDNRPLFSTIAGLFIDKSQSLVDELRAFLRKGALVDAVGVFHQLKGLAATVGNMPLARMASQLEAELKHASKLADSSTALTRLESLLVAGNTEIERFLASFEAEPPALESEVPLDRAVNPEQIRSLIQLLEERNLRALDVYQELIPAFKATLPAERDAVLVAAMDALDFAAAASVLHAAELNRCP